MFQDKLGLKGIRSINDLLTRAQPYTNYKEKLIAEDVETNMTSENFGPGKQGYNKRRVDRDWDMHNGPHARFSEYTLMNTLR